MTTQTKLQKAAEAYRKAEENLAAKRAALAAEVGKATTTGGLQVVDAVRLSGWSRAKVSAIKAETLRTQASKASVDV